MDIITQIDSRLNPPGYMAASPATAEIQTKQPDCLMMLEDGG
ncbi:hypothetical protein [Burkholderia sp. BCC0405]|nr:hypothetical protein [Burkholderia sp. BCC0405]